MKKINYRITVNIKNKIMKLGFRGQLPESWSDRNIRVQAVFTQRQVDRRFPMEVRIEESDIGQEIHADAVIELPYVFMTPPRRRVSVTFALWCDMEEILLDDQPFPVQKELFSRNDLVIRKNHLKFAGLTLLMPFMVAGDYFKSGKDLEKSKKKVNEYVFRRSGISYSPRQQNTGYFAEKYLQEVKKNDKVSRNTILFLSERYPEEGDNLARIKRMFEADPDVEVTEFIHTETVDKLSKSQLKECAEKCARAGVIILEDFYPQLHSLSVRPETSIVQLWHACGAFKTFGYSHMGKPGGAPQSSMNHRNYDLVTVSSEQIRGLYAEAFALPYKKVKALGVPRTDDLFDWQYKRSKREELYRRYPVLRDNKVVLFAPTFRGDGNKDAFYPPEAFDVRLFMDKMPEDTVCIIKNHPFVREQISIPEDLADRVLDLSEKEPVNDLLLVADLLITDYSSVIFEAVILEIPVLFYAFDLEDYIQKRDFYFDFESMVPGPVEKDMEGLIQKAGELMGEGNDEESCLQDSSDDARIAQKTEQFRETFLSALDGHGSEKIYQYIKTHYIKKDQ